jgi:ACS family hexuronate transporter-like MFS transporter
MLLLATTVNYIDRIALNQSAKRIKTDLTFDDKGYGQLESRFGIAFAAGSLISGILVDRFGPRLMYPMFVILWSAAGAATVLVKNFDQLLWCRIALGFFEGGNWPCALNTTQRILAKHRRSLGNGILQSGTAVGSVVTPLILYLSLRYVPNATFGGWRLPFWLAGVLGLAWSVAWLILVRPNDLSAPTVAEKSKHDVSRWGALSLFRDPRMWALCVLVVAVNSTWHFFRAWTPLFLQDARGYPENTVFWFSMVYYGAADIGAISCGFLTLAIVNRGAPVHRGRMIVFFAFACLALMSVPVAFMDRGLLLLILLVVLGFASLGVFPNYYAFTQELTTKHQGKVSGILGCVNWIAMFFLQDGVGTFVKNNKARHLAEALASGMAEPNAILQAGRLTYEWPLALAGAGPLIGFIVMLILYRPQKPSTTQSS